MRVKKATLSSTAPIRRSRHRQLFSLIRRRQLFSLLIFCTALSVISLIGSKTLADTDDYNPNIYKLPRFLVAALRKISPFMLKGHRACFEKNLDIPLTEEGTPASRFGVALVHVPEDLTLGLSDYQQQILNVATRNRIQYCERHGYTFLNGSDWYLNSDPVFMKQINGRTHWLKSTFLADVFRTMAPASASQSKQTTYPYPHLDWVLYMDSDIAIMNMDIEISQIIAGATAHEGLVVTREADRVNAGAFVISSSPSGRAIMDVWATGAVTKFLWSDQTFFRGMFGENQELDVNKEFPGGLILSNNKDSSVVANPPRYKVVPPCKLQCCGGLEYSSTLRRPYTEGLYVPGDFAVHFFGKRDKLALLKMAIEGNVGFFS
jgi:hypothetical protein